MSYTKKQKIKKFNPPKSKRKLDLLFSKYIHASRNHTCEWCGKVGGCLNVSHCIPRECLSLRWSEDNVCLLCYFHHKRMWHHSPLLAVDWFNKKYGVERGNRLIESSNVPYEFNESEANRIELKLKNESGGFKPLPLSK